MLSRPLLLVALSCASFIAAGCGDEGPSPSADAGHADSDGGGPTEAGQDASAGCPTTMPGDGTPCTSLALQCEYGDFDWTYCNSTATCTTQGWSVAPPVSNVCAPNNTSCPQTSADIPHGGACSSPLNCFFSDATCSCNTKGGTTADGGPVWTCDDPPSGCPSPRPHLGVPCAQDGQVCDYASCGKGVNNIEEQCKDGLWKFVFPMCDGG